MEIDEEMDNNKPDTLNNDVIVNNEENGNTKVKTETTANDQQKQDIKLESQNHQEDEKNNVNDKNQNQNQNHKKNKAPKRIKYNYLINPENTDYDDRLLEALKYPVVPANLMPTRTDIAYERDGVPQLVYIFYYIYNRIYNLCS